MLTIRGVSAATVAAALGLGVLAAGGGPRRAAAQVSLADDIVLASKGEEGGNALSPAEPELKLGPSPGSRGGPFLHTPGTQAVLLGASSEFADLVPLPTAFVRPGASSSLSNPSWGQVGPGKGLSEGLLGFAPGGRGGAQLTATVPAPIPAFGLPEPPAGESEDMGPEDGLTFDAAVDRALKASPEMRAKGLEIPMAEADAITAGLRSNPLLFYDSTGVPYGSYSPRRPGDIDHGISVVYPIDYSGKRRARVDVAIEARRVLQAQYQDAVRREIQRVASDFVDVLAARQAVRYARSSRELLDLLLAAARAVEGSRAQGGETAEEVEGLEIERETADLLVSAEEDRLRKARRALGTRLFLSPEDADRLEPRGSLRDTGPPPPPAETLVALALNHRPDLAAHRLGVRRARADVRLARADRLADAYFLYTPFTYRDNSQTDTLSARSWGIGLFVSMPLFDRNQGNILRSRLNSEQARAELIALERKVVTEVRSAAEDYTSTRRDLERLESRLLPALRRKRERALIKFRAGRIDADDFLRTQRDHSSVVRHHRDTVVRHRRSMDALNAAVGRRLFP